jgi:choline dehydrogenase-like flavoprotein
MRTPPTSTKTSLGQRLSDRARQRWPALDRVNVRFRGPFAYIDAHLPDGEIMPLCRLRYGGSASIWGFAIYRASHNDYQDSFLPTGATAGSPEQALDCACGLYLGEPTAWVEAITDTPTN